MNKFIKISLFAFFFVNCFTLISCDIDSFTRDFSSSAIECKDGHNLEYHEQISATCTSEGTLAHYHCLTCNSDFLDDKGTKQITNLTINKTNHEFGEYTNDNNATCVKNATKSAKCKYCETIDTLEIPDSKIEHEIISETINPTCTEQGYNYHYCKNCDYSYKDDFVDALNHDYEVEIVEVSCVSDGYTSHICKRCNDSYIDNIIKCQGHDLVHIEGKEATLTSDGYHAYDTCKNCSYSTYKKIPKLEYSLPSIYSSTYGYDFLATYEDGAMMQEIYSLIDEKCLEFHTEAIDAKTYNENYYSAFKLDVSKYGLTSTSLLKKICYTYQYDHPLYYWLTMFSFDCQHIYALTRDEYQLGSKRLEYNQKIYSYMEENARELKESSIYSTALNVHDLIASKINYALDESGNPSTKAIHHNILGFFTSDSGVCECYAKVFQLFMNAYNYNSIYVVGSYINDVHNEDHAWNLLKLDDNKYYWIDVTFDDTPETLDYYHKFFAKSDNDLINIEDYQGYINTSTFIETHSAFSKDDSIFLYDLPKSSKTSFKLETIAKIDDQFEDNNLTYQIISSNEVALISTNTNIVNIPEKVCYLNKEFVVSCISGVDSSKALGTNELEAKVNIEELNISKEIKTIYVGALNISINGQINVDENNIYFCFENNLLLDKEKKCIYGINSSVDEITILESVKMLKGIDQNYSGTIRYNGDPNTSDDAINDFINYFTKATTSINVLPPKTALYFAGDYGPFELN